MSNRTIRTKFEFKVGNYYKPYKYIWDIDPYSIINSKLNIRWKKSKEMLKNLEEGENTYIHYLCKVLSYNPENNTHFCIYDDGDKKDYDISTKLFEVVSIPIVKEKSIKKTTPNNKNNKNNTNNNILEKYMFCELKPLE
tara:strand:- start:734 stop:1150 length:417 start_codon:yes stop_codon:yes gene_type:complete